ncbi:hypothetical protein FACS1894191_2850 [Clostridia bacterium]|nr:hypothetical protein FACS1894191_2850 [Clostridia bacterium]
MHYIGYMLKAGHIAVITEAVVTGQVPSDQIAYGKQRVTERFATSNVYFAKVLPTKESRPFAEIFSRREGASLFALRRFEYHTSGPAYGFIVS